jgi:YhcH/YjgK/YiaL family protein
MIIDKIENAKLYFGINERITKALKFLLTEDLLNIKEGKHEIAGDDIYVLINVYDTKNPSDSNLEAHRKFIDIQYVVSGSELIGLATLKEQKPSKEYDEKKDYLLFKEDCSFMKLEQGMFAILFPDDLHMPGIKISKPAKVKKVVIKVRA